MTQIFLPPKSDISHQKLYCYTNASPSVAIVRVPGIEDWHGERVVFPSEKFLFRANNDCELEISRQTNVGIINDLISCFRLEVVEN